MEFLGIGYQEVLLVLVLLLVVVGPQRLPEVAYQIGRAVREMQKYARAVRDEFQDEFDYLDAQARELRGEVDAASRDLDDVRRSLRSESRQLDRELKEATAPIEKEIAAASADSNGTSPALATRSTLSSARVSIDGEPAKRGQSSRTGAAATNKAANETSQKKPAEGDAATSDAGSESAESKPGKPPLVF